MPKDQVRCCAPYGQISRTPSVCDTGYYERFNQDNVHIVNCRETPIQEITEKGILTSDGKVHEVDVIIFATGFSPVDGNYNRVRFHGKGGQSIRERWYHSPSSLLGNLCAGFPNMYMLMGPSGPFANVPPIVRFHAF
jgi:cyclohexanone monooxygenase